MTESMDRTVSRLSLLSYLVVASSGIPVAPVGAYIVGLILGLIFPFEGPVRGVVVMIVALVAVVRTVAQIRHPDRDVPE